MSPGEAERIGELLIEEGVVTLEELGRAIAEGGLKGSALAIALQASPHVRRADLAAFLAADFRLPVLQDLRNFEFSDEAIKLVPEDIARKHEVVPLARLGGVLCVAKSNYYNRAAVQDLRRVTHLKVKVLQADEGQVRAALDRIYKGKRGELPQPRDVPKTETAVLRATPPRVAEQAALEAIPLISMSDTPARAPAPGSRPKEAPVTAPVVVRPFARPRIDDVAEILNAVKVTAQEYANAQRTPFLSLVTEFDDVFSTGKAVPPYRVS